MKLAIFDLDDTLIDFASTRQVAYRCLSQHLEQRGLDAPAFLQGCVRVDRPLFALFEQGKLTRDEYRLRRFADPLAEIGVASDAGLVKELNKLFMDCVNDRPLVFADVEPVLERMRIRGIRTAILTNGPSDGQRRKLVATGLGGSVDHVVIGEELGFSKPSARAFHAVVEKFGFNPADALMVGDSPELDYDAAIDAGLSALLLDRDGRHGAGGRTSISSLEAVLAG
jgi:putative hydrolase of the HAD superfamily